MCRLFSTPMYLFKVAKALQKTVEDSSIRDCFEMLFPSVNAETPISLTYGVASILFERRLYKHTNSNIHT